jgi:hypothetical protein
MFPGRKFLVSTGNLTIFFLRPLLIVNLTLECFYRFTFSIRYLETRKQYAERL